MSPERKRALQWFHNMGEVSATGNVWMAEPSMNIIGRMLKDGQLQRRDISPWKAVYSLTDKGRRMLHGDNA